VGWYRWLLEEWSQEGLSWFVVGAVMFVWVLYGLAFWLSESIDKED
jgi:hypothetical protein